MKSTIMSVIAVCVLVSSVSYAQTVTPVQKSTITWDAYVNPAPVPPATVTPPNLQLAAYQINRGVGAAVCNIVAQQLPTPLVTIPVAVAPGVTPTSFVDTTYPDANGIVCWEVYLKFADGTFSPRSKRLIKEIISLKPTVANADVQ
jgi:hypothetical protein